MPRPRPARRSTRRSPGARNTPCGRSSSSRCRRSPAPTSPSTWRSRTALGRRARSSSATSGALWTASGSSRRGSSSVAELEALLALQTADSDLDAKRARLDEIKASLGASAGLSAARAAVEAADRELKAHEATQRQLEWQVDDLSDKIRELDARLYSGRIGNPKELASLQTEIQHMRADLGALEERALEAIDATDRQRAEVERLRRERADVEARWRDDQTAMKNEQTEMSAATE